MNIEDRPNYQRYKRLKRRSRSMSSPIGRIVLVLFALPFAGAGIGFFIFLVYPDVQDWVAAQSWHAVDGQIVSARLDTSTSGDSSTAEVLAQYRYSYLGNEYTGNRVAIATGKDNIGSFQERLAQNLQDAQRNDGVITVYVNPDNPTESIINREMRWGLLTLKMVFVVLFGGIGLVLLISVIRKPKPAPIEETTEAIVDPAQIKKEWASPVIRSSAKSMVYVMWGFAVFWNLVTLPVALQIPKELAKGEWGILFVLIFNVIGLVLIVMAIKKTLEWRRFGVTPLTMDPHPGSIGGHVGGNIDIKLPYDMANKFSIVLSSVRSYVSGSGKNRSRSESVKWQDTLVASSEPSMNGTRLSFRFDVPEGLQASEKHSDDYYKWHVDLKADLQGIDMDRRFEIPVFATKEKSKFIAESAATKEDDDLHSQPEDLPVQISFSQGGMELYYPIGRAKIMAVSLLLFGAAFSGIGVFLGYEFFTSTRSEVIAGFMAFMFFFFGSLIEIGGIYSLMYSLWVRLDSSGISTKRCLLGVAVIKRNIAKDNIQAFEIDRGSQSGTTVYYNVFVKTKDNRKIKVGESFIGSSSARKMMEKMKDVVDM